VVAGSDLAGKWLKRVRRGLAKLRGKARRLGATPAAALLGSAPPELEKDEGDGERTVRARARTRIGPNGG